MNELIELKHDNLVVSSHIFADGFGIEHESLMRLVKTHQEAIESNFNLVAFEIGARLEGRHGGGETKTAYFTEDQATFIGTLLRNSEKAVMFKIKLVKAFSEARKPKELTRKELALMVVQIEEEKEQLQLQVENLNTALDSLVEWVSIIKVATKNRIKETAINWRLLKKKSEEMGYSIKKAQSPRYGYQNLYHINTFKVCYPQFDYNFS